MVYSAFRAIPAWHSLPKGEKGKAIAEYLARVDDFKGLLILRTYSTLWSISPDLDALQALTEELRVSSSTWT